VIRVVDGHNDYLLRIAAERRGLREPGDRVHIDLAQAAGSGFAGGFFACFVPGGPVADPTTEHYALPLPPPLDPANAKLSTEELAGILLELERDGSLRIARSVDDFAGEGVTAILHFEGAEAIDVDLANLESWYERGLRSIGLVWSRPNAFAEGVPFAFPGHPDTGPGLTAAGRKLVTACNELGILVDLSHLNERGFFDVARLSAAPLVASHSNAHALCAVTRNLTDEQLDAIRDSGGIVGVNFAVTFLREDGRLDTDTPLETVVRHFDHLVERMGIDHVGFGSDFDGAVIPAAIGDVTGLPRVLDALRDAGYREPDLRKLARENWLRVLRATWRGA